MNINGLYRAAIAFSMIQKSYIHDEKNRILREWENTMFLPRKKKKASRKKLNFDWNLLHKMYF